MPTVPKTTRNRPGEVKIKLLDAAEALFAARGFDGVSIRDIVARADVMIGAFTYHFPSKLDLFAEVIHRRGPLFREALGRSLADALAQAGGHPTTEQMIRAYLKPAFDLLLGDDTGWKNYMELAIRSMNLRQDDAVLQPLWEEMVPAQTVVVDAFAHIYPDADVEDLNWAVHFMVACTMHLLLQTGLVERQSGGLCLSTNLPRIYEKLVPYLEVGFDKMVRKPAA